jgi:type I restriction enzyme, R subunit
MSRDFNRWGFDIRPHRELMKRGFDMPDSRRMDVEDAFKDPMHPFRVVIVCAMWLTGFDVECLSTLYLDKPMKAHTLMQAIAWANRRYADKTCGVIVDYNGMLRSLREALAQYALGDEVDDGGNSDEIVAPIEELVKALVEAIEAAEQHLKNLGFDVSRLQGAAGFERIEALRDATNAVYTADEAKRRFEILARLVFARFKALLMEPPAFTYAERHDNLESIYKKLQERRDTSDVTELLKELHKIVNEAIRTQGMGEDHAEGLMVDLSQLDFQRLRDEFAKVRLKQALLQDIREMVEQKLQQMLRYNPQGMDYYKKYQEIIADYNREKDRTTVEESFARLFNLANSLDAEQQRAAQEGLSHDELALFDLLSQTQISKADRERLKQASKRLLASLQELLKPMENWTQKAQTQAEVKVFILDRLFETLPNPPYSINETQAAADRIYEYIWQRSANGNLFPPDMAA